MTAEQLEADLAAIRVGHDPDQWAIAAYRLAVARSETASGTDDVHDALRLLDKAGRILTAERSPLEHGRILTATANCQRQLGDASRAARLFDDAARLIADRAPRNEQAASFINQGLARTEAGRPAEAIRPLDEALALLDRPSHDTDPDETRRMRGAALVNRAQTRHALGDTESLTEAVADYRAAMSFFDPDAPQLGMALHGTGTILLELAERTDGSPDNIGSAILSFRESLLILTENSFTFQHAVAQHSLGVAYERRGTPNDLGRSLNCVEIALGIFDPRLHAGQWTTTMATLSRIEGSLSVDRPGLSRVEHIVGLMVRTDGAERNTLMRDRLLRISRLPQVRMQSDLDALSNASVSTGLDDYAVLLRSMIPALMELPDTILETTCASLCDAHRRSGRSEDFDRALDSVIHDLLHGPQRVRVRDLLAAQGWIRP